MTSQTFSEESISEYLNEYVKALSDGFLRLDRGALDAAKDMLNHARKNGLRVFVAGNGGSAAICLHLECDWRKGCHVRGKPGLQTQVLSSNVALLTALANDISYEEVFSHQLEMAGAKFDEVLLLISSSGNSPNIVKAAEMGKTRGMNIIGMTGFEGGRLKELSDISLHIPVNNYGVVEDAHQGIMHILAQYHALKMDL